MTNEQRVRKVIEIGHKNLATLNAEADRLREIAKADPFVLGAVQRAVEARAIADGYDRAITDLIEGMIVPVLGFGDVAR